VGHIAWSSWPGRVAFHVPFRGRRTWDGFFYRLHCSRAREIKAAEIVRIPLSPTIAADAADLLRSGKANVFGADSGVGYPAAEALPGAKIVPGAFGTVLVAAALPKGRSPTAQALLATLVDQAKQTGVVQKAIDAKGLKGVNVVTK
jgi:polar amino acid transport system substrate-binding protein